MTCFDNRILYYIYCMLFLTKVNLHGKIQGWLSIEPWSMVFQEHIQALYLHSNVTVPTQFGKCWQNCLTKSFWCLVVVGHISSMFLPKQILSSFEHRFAENGSRYLFHSNLSWSHLSFTILACRIDWLSEFMYFGPFGLRFTTTEIFSFFFAMWI